MLLSSRLRGMRALTDGLLREGGMDSRLSFRVQPWDVDLNVHLTNGRYPQLMDVGRIHLITRSGLGAALWAQRVRPIAVELHLTFRKELGLGRRFTLHTAVTGRERKALVFTQRFLVGDEEHAVGTVNVVLLGGRGVVDPMGFAEVLPDVLGEGQVQGSAERADQ